MRNDALTNDNDTWSAIGLQAALILNRFQNAKALLELSEEKQQRPDNDRASGDHGKKRPLDDLDYVEFRLKQIAEWERRISGIKSRRRKSSE